MLGLLLSLHHALRSLRKECSSKNGADLEKSSWADADVDTL